jgi:molecular chaperone DnaK (HSP70)
MMVGIWKPKSTDGEDTHLVEDDFDNKIIDWMLSEIKSEDGTY